ncbi:class I adenylate-forming enzyme family protein [Ruegeria arenilitoris]|uniref:class I adenylate-forming enzyme family protein n=1 Tax=Ruegeria arenilitoris TaxID=1173585 RepID=UPI001480ABD5|nr:class I adenylate-forming enzyme family protein [Ruegeria arenilitoris]
MSARQQLISWFDAIATDRPNDVAVVNDICSTTFSELSNRVADHRKRLRNLLGTNATVVGHAVSNGPEAVAIEMAAWAEGHASLAFPRQATLREYKEMLSVVTPELLLVDTKSSVLAELGASVFSVISLDGSGETVMRRDRRSLPVADTLQLQFTSGSTGRPKAVCLEAAAVLASLRSSQDWYDSFPKAPVFSVLPQNHAMGRASVFETLWSGRTVVCSDKKTPGENHALMRTTGCRTLLCNPTYARLGLAFGVLTDVSPIERIVIGSASVDATLVSQLQSSVPHLCIDVRYGVSEAFGALSVKSISHEGPPHQTGDVGRPLPGVEFRAQDDSHGPISARSPFTAVAQVEESGVVLIRDPSGYIATGDTGSITHNGNLVLSGRSNLTISHRGHRIDPIEIETVVKETGSFIEAIVIGVPDTLSGEKIAIAVVPHEDDVISADQIKDHCKRQLSAHKVPHWVIEMPEIPNKASGKPDRIATRDRVMEALGLQN